MRARECVLYLGSRKVRATMSIAGVAGCRETFLLPVAALVTLGEGGREGGREVGRGSLVEEVTPAFDELWFLEEPENNQDDKEN